MQWDPVQAETEDLISLNTVLSLLADATVLTDAIITHTNRHNSHARRCISCYNKATC